MKQLSKAIVIALVVVVLAACESVDDVVTREVVVDSGEETGTAVPPTTLPDTPTPTATLASSQTPVPTDIALPTIFATATPPSEPSSTPRPTPTPLSLSELIWENGITVVANAPSDSLVWSPTSNEFVFDHCAEYDEFYQLPTQFAFVSTAPDFTPVSITPIEVACSVFTYFEWRPDGQQILLNGLPISSPLLEIPLLDSTIMYIMDRDGSNLRHINSESWLFEIYGWMDNDRLVKRSYRGGGNWIVSIFDIESDIELAWAWIYAHQVSEVDSDYVITESGIPGIHMSAAVFSETTIRPQEEPVPRINSREGSGPYLNYLSVDDNQVFGELSEVHFNSRFEDWISESNQMLVLTWAAYQRLFEFDILHDSGLTDLKIWDVKTDELTLVVPGGIYGRISPNRHYLVFLTPSSDFPQLQLLDRISGEILFAQPTFAEASEYDAKVSAYTTFSPNGRFLTFFNPAHELLIYDLENGEFLAPVTAVPATPLWSPDSSRFVYHDPAAGLSIFDTRSAAAYPLAISGSDRLSDPQWSFDGTYLSVTVLQENWWEQKTAVLQIP